MMLYALKRKISLPNVDVGDIDKLIEDEWIEVVDDTFNLTDKSNKIVIKYDNYFIKAKKQTSNQLLGKNYNDNLNGYREIFPSGKLPSGKPGRNNVKVLEDSFRWFFENYTYTWDEVLKATKMYVNEYRDKEYLYMQTSQYFICKQDRNKVKHSSLADYCDMIRDGVETEDQHFKEKVV